MSSNPTFTTTTASSESRLPGGLHPNLPGEVDIELDMVFERSDAIPTVVNASWELELYSVEEAGSNTPQR